MNKVPCQLQCVPCMHGNVLRLIRDVDKLIYVPGITQYNTRRSILNYPKLLEHRNSYDIFCASETHINSYDLVNIPKYDFHSLPRSQEY